MKALKDVYRAGVMAWMATLAACSSLDPNVGPLHFEPPDSEDAGSGEDADTGPDGEDIDPGGISFHLQIRPIIDRPKDVPADVGTGRGCKGCHYRTEPTHNGIDLGGFDMTTLGALRKGGGSSGSRIIVPGKPNESVIIQVLKQQYPYANRMPKGGQYWGSEEVQLLSDWIAQGAKGRADE